MRSFILAAATTAALLATPAAIAAPTCQNGNGQTVRCGTPGAMPLGWTLSPEERLARQIAGPKEPTTNELLEVICVLGVFFAWMALLPDFDGRWDKQGPDDET